MQRIHSTDRLQMVFDNLENQIEKDHPVRFIDAFVDAIELDKIGIITKRIQCECSYSFESEIFAYKCLSAYKCLATDPK